MTQTDAERFTHAYASIRARESWAERDRARRTAAVAESVELMRRELGENARIVSVGSGAVRLPGVIAIDLLATADVTADMRALPFGDGSIDGALYAASLHYAPLAVAVAEASRILRPGAVLVVIDSPLYDGQPAASAARARSAEYYARAGRPELAAHYHPIELGELRDALATNGLEVARLSTGSRWRRILRRGPRSFVFARKLR